MIGRLDSHMTQFADTSSSAEPGPPAAGWALRLRATHKRYGAVQALRGLDLAVERLGGSS